MGVHRQVAARKEHISSRSNSLLSCEVLAQKSCEPCVTVKGDSGDPLIGEYQLIGQDSGCVEYGCAYTKDGGSDVYCFKDGSYEAELPDTCPISPLPGSTPTGGSTPGGGSTGPGGSTPAGGSTAPGGSTPTEGSTGPGGSTPTEGSTGPGGSGSTDGGTTLGPPAITKEDIEETKQEITNQVNAIAGLIASLSQTVQDSIKPITDALELLETE